MSNELRRCLFIVAGTVCVIVGAIGVVVPVLPTTPFLLLAAACYTRGSPRLYSALLSNRLFGGYLRNYLEGRGMTLRAKIWTLCLLWIGIALAAALATDSLAIRMLLTAVLVGVTLHILMVGSPQPDTKPAEDLQPE